MAELQPALFDECGALVVAGAPFVEFEMGGPPRGKGRPRGRIVYPRGKKPFIHFYNDSETSNYEDDLKQAARLFMRHRAPVAGPLWLSVWAFMPIPQSWTMREKADARMGAILPTTKPDFDNIAKMVDALKGIVWVDDAHVADAHIHKRYADDPGLRIEVRQFVPPVRERRPKAAA